MSYYFFISKNTGTNVQYEQNSSKDIGTNANRQKY